MSASSSSSEALAKINAAFAEHGLAAPESVDHAEVTTSDAHREALGADWLAKGRLVVNLFCKDKKKKLYLIVADADRRVNLSALAKQINAGGKSLRFAAESQLQASLGVAQGCVTPLAVINNSDKKVIVVLDQTLVADKAQKLLVHPLVNDKTVAVGAGDLLTFIGKYVDEANIKTVDMDAGAPAGGANAASSNGGGKKQQKQKKKQQQQQPKKKKKKAGFKKGENALGLSVAKEEDFATWYQQVVTRSEMIEYYDISGCYILRPWSYGMWEFIQSFFDGEIKKLGVKNSYFPVFVSQSALTKEEDHIEGFAPEVAWVTHAGESELPEKIAIRPTSETIMYPAFAKWIRSHRDLPLRLNQWSNVVRWEFKHPTPFIRSREFLWQEGHTAHATLKEAEVEVLQILDLYAAIYEELLAVPVVKGRKTEKEKFAGGMYTTTIESFIPSTGRGVQSATSHCLGQNFSKMFNIRFEDENAKEQLVWQNSWGCTTRSIGVMVMVHGDDKGLVVPPRVAPTQVVIVPIYFKDVGENKAADDKAYELADQLKAAGVRTEVDSRRNYNPGWKYAHWELKGVPLRIELGPKDFEKQSVVVVRRDTGAKKAVSWADLTTAVPAELEQMQADMLTRARGVRDSRLKKVTDWDSFHQALNKACMALAPFCDQVECEESIKTRSAEAAENVEEQKTEDGEEVDAARQLSGAAKSLCTPFDQPELPEGLTCVNCAKKAVNWTLFGRSY